MAGRLEGKVAIITGGCSGLGAATVDLFEQQGARVVVADIQDDLGTAREAASKGGVRFVRCDVTKEDDIAGAIAFAQKTFGGLDVLFNNAGPGKAYSPITAMTIAEWDGAMALLLRGPMLGIKHAVPLMQARGGGSIINTASIAGLRPGISSPAYSVAKAGVVHLTRMAALELGGHRIRVNAICPGIFPTQGPGDLFGFTREKIRQYLPQIEAVFGKAQPLQRSGKTMDIARTALFLASDESSFTTGQEFVVDGGMMIKGPGSMEAERPDGVLKEMFALRDRIAAAEAEK